MCLTSLMVPVRCLAGMASARLMLGKAAAAAVPARKLRRVVIVYRPLFGLKKTDRGVQRRLGTLRGGSGTQVPSRSDADVNNLFPNNYCELFSVHDDRTGGSHRNGDQLATLSK